MTHELADQVSDDEKQLIEQLAASLSRRGWRLPALIALEAGRPLTFIGGQLLWLAQPALSLFMAGDEVRRMALVLENPRAVTALLECLETAVVPTGERP